MNSMGTFDSHVDMNAINAMLHASSQNAPMQQPKIPGSEIALSDEQQAVIDAVLAGRDVIVDATVGSGKTATIQRLCFVIRENRPKDRILYLTYSKLLKADAQMRVRGAKVQNYHGIVYPSLLRAGISCGISESIGVFNDNFKQLSADFDTYDVLIVDEYQDINEDHAELLRNIKSKNPLMQVIMVGDMEQRVRNDSRHNAQEFARSFCVDPLFLPFTTSFRMGPDMASRLARGWNKPIRGGNETQEVITMPYDMAVAEIMSMADRPGDILCLGKREGMMTRALNQIERDAPESFNKNTIFASIKGNDGGVEGVARSAIFTTFDSAKGLERDTCFIFDFTDDNFQMRLRLPNSDSEVLRNVFLVAASRGKRRIVFVKPKNITGGVMNLWSDFIGFVSIKSFVELPAATKPQYHQVFSVDEMFDFKYVETIEDAYDLLDVTRIDDGSAEVIDAPQHDGLIELAPAVAAVQESLFFSGFDHAEELSYMSDQIGLEFQSLTERRRTMAVEDNRFMNKWDKALVLTAVLTGQERYATQVSESLSTDVADAIVSRMGEQLSPDDPFQCAFEMSGQARSRDGSTPIKFGGILDVIHDDVVIELKFTSELKHAHFLQLAMYMLMSDKDEGMLWNIRTDERWKVTIPDRQRFLDSVVTCVTKQNYQMFGDAA